MRFLGDIYVCPCNGDKGIFLSSHTHTDNNEASSILTFSCGNTRILHRHTNLGKQKQLKAPVSAFHLFWLFKGFFLSLPRFAVFREIVSLYTDVNVSASGFFLFLTAHASLCY